MPFTEELACGQVKKAVGEQGAERQPDLGKGHWVMRVRSKHIIRSFLLPFNILRYVVFSILNMRLGGNKFFSHKFLSFILYFLLVAVLLYRVYTAVIICQVTGLSGL